MVIGRDGKPKLAMDHGVAMPKERPRTRRFLAVDPGDVHVGVAEFEQVGSEPWRAVWAYEWRPDEFMEWLHLNLQRMRWDWLVVEEWRLFPEHAPRAVGSDMPTSRLIGSIQAIARFSPPATAWFDRGECPIHYQTPQIKVPTRSMLKRRKLRSVAKILKISGDHASDAELHGYHYLIRQDEPIWNATVQAQVSAPDLTPSQALW